MSVDGYIGNFKVKIKKKPRYVDVEKCVGCGACAEACRLKGRIPNEFDMNLGKRSAIYVPFPQAVPLKYTIDPEHCLTIKIGKCGEYPLCKEACERDAIDFDQKEEIVEVDVGTIVVATGFDLFNPATKPEYGYGKYGNVITGLEFERLVSASGPTSGHIEINGRTPRRVVFIQCVGSRDKKGNEYCSRVCCMYTAKQAHMVREKIPDADVVVYYTDVRAFGKGFEEFYNRVVGEGVVYRRRELDDPIEVVEEDGRIVVKARGHSDVVADLVVLATGIIPRGDSKEFARVLNVNQSADGFLLEAHPKLRPVDTFTDGVFLAGCCQSPKDIPDAVAQASAAAVRASEPLAQGKVEVEAISAWINEELCSGCRVCEDLCAYSALEFDGKNKIMRVNDVMCKGCGSCASACPSGAISMRHFDVKQILAQIGGIISGS
jgi:heterodisulfide reductase subunit A